MRFAVARPALGALALKAALVGVSSAGSNPPPVVDITQAGATRITAAGDWLSAGAGGSG
jgi:hypothetical protein